MMGHVFFGTPYIWQLPIRRWDHGLSREADYGLSSRRSRKWPLSGRVPICSSLDYIVLPIAFLWPLPLLEMSAVDTRQAWLFEPAWRRASRKTAPFMRCVRHHRPLSLNLTIAWWLIRHRLLFSRICIVYFVFLYKRQYHKSKFVSVVFSYVTKIIVDNSTYSKSKSFAE
jgi:hypothetical protein